MLLQYNDWAWNRASIASETIPAYRQTWESVVPESIGEEVMLDVCRRWAAQVNPQPSAP